ncbi:hypothetical protein GcM3_025050 [Golovinomyces cichoracearum]|uniref:Uncharacterized protein n=1 Tax=Golovinomyces cichoracearum TaxID=62708 RepID=A0A420J6L2_9PEZI|nr:hypothetical protein GcM3_025050 [Golovinomyces cichoracearum]
MVDDKSDTAQPQFEGQSQAYARAANNTFDPIELGWDSGDFKLTTATTSELRAYLEWRINEIKAKTLQYLHNVGNIV